MTERDPERDADPLAIFRERIEAARRYDEAHPESPFVHLLDADTGRLVQVRRDDWRLEN